MDGLLVVPALFVLMMAFGYRYVIRRKSLGGGGWLAVSSLVLFFSVAIPFVYGVWLPDVFGGEKTLCSATTSTGYQVSVVQYWNHVDFYTTEARVVSPEGVTTVSLLDGDACKTWGATLAVDPSQTGATFILPNGRSGWISW